ncbi:MAG: hypothetical protein ACI30X_07065 [Muribaculaceae bacterium]
MADNKQVLTVFEPQNVQTIAELAPQSYKDNELSHDRCLQVGNQLLARVQREGMNDELDIDIAKFIEKTKVTIKKMNGKRTPVTQLFDRIRSAYTSLENDIDPAKVDTVPNVLQSYRNAYAKKKHDEEVRRMREEAARQAKEFARARYRSDVEDDFVRQFNALVNNSINELIHMDKIVNLDNYELVFDGVKEYICQLPETWLQKLRSGAPRPSELSSDDCRTIVAEVFALVANRFKEQYTYEVGATRDEILEHLPSKKIELQRIAQASADEAAAIKANMEAREREEAQRKEAERLEREKQEEEAKKLAAQKQEMDSLFGAPAESLEIYKPKTQVKKVVVINSVDDVMKVLAFWWSQEGCTKSIDELCKEFKKQITYANTVANARDKQLFIDGVTYEDEVKAK